MILTNIYRGRQYDIIQAVESELDGNDYDRGHVETAQAAADNCAAYLAKLTNILFTSRIITKEELFKLLPSFKEL